MMVFSAAAEVISLGLVLPFIAALAAPTEVLANPLVADVASRFGVETADRLVIALTLAFSIAAIAAGLFRILVVWSNTRWTFATGADLSLEVYRRTLYQPYRVHVSRSSSEMISGITGKIGHTTLGVLLPLLVLTTSCILILAIAITLLLIDPVVSGFAMVAFGGSYLLVTRIARRRLRRNSGRIAEEHTQVVKVLQEGLGGGPHPVETLPEHRGIGDVAILGEVRPVDRPHEGGKPGGPGRRAAHPCGQEAAAGEGRRPRCR